jgi:hypothetical protein
MKNLIQKLKAKLQKTETKIMVAAGALGANVGLAYCEDKDVNAMAQSVMNLIFNGIMYVGIGLTAFGLIQLVRCVMAVSGGDNLQPGQLGKAIGLTVGGIVCICMKVLIKTITGTDVGGVTLT